MHTILVDLLSIWSLLTNRSCQRSKNELLSSFAVRLILRQVSIQTRQHDYQMLHCLLPFELAISNQALRIPRV